MKRFLIGFISIVTLLTFFSSALAIDRAPKDSKAEEKEKPAEFKEGKKSDVKEGKTKGIDTLQKSEKTKRTVPENLTKRLKSQEKQKAEEKYDYFIDKNNNGIDDRLERQKPKEPVSTPAVRPAPKEKQTAKPAPSTENTGQTKEIKEAPKKKEVKEAKKIEGKKRR